MRYLLVLLLGIISPMLQAQTFPDNIFADSACAPFYYGVASGDPLQTQLIIWTKIEPTKKTDELLVNWEIATDSFFRIDNQQGKILATTQSDFTVKIDVKNLLPNTQYYYRFFIDSYRFSAIGLGKTLPTESVSKFKLAVVSCSSIWSGYFNAYRQIAKRKDIDFVVHLGDYAYDYADKDELHRMPTPYPVDVSSLAEWRERHTYYLLDPDLRAARQNKSWIAIWDNHDVDC